MKRTATAVLMAMVFVTATASAKEDSPSALALDIAWPIVERASRSADINARADGIRAMRFVQGRDVAGFFTDALADAQWSVRKPAIIGLVRLGDPKAVALLEECLYNPSLPLADDAMELVNEVPGGQGRAMFIKALMDRANPARDMLVGALVAQPPETIASILGDCVDQDPALLDAVLAKVCPAALPTVLNVMAADKRGTVSLAAVRVAIDKGLPVDKAVLSQMLKSKDVATRYMAAEKLACQGDSEAVNVLLPLADGDLDSKMRFLNAAAKAPSAAAQAKAWSMLKPDISTEMLGLIYMCFPATTDINVIKQIDEDAFGTDAARRPPAVRAIGRVKGTRAIPQLNDLVTRDGNRDVRVAAALSLGDLGQAESVPVLREASNDSDIEVKMAVLEALGRINDRSVIGVANYMAFDPNPKVKMAALKVIANINHPDAIQVLRVAADDPDPAIRHMVLAAMMRLDKASALARFERALLGLGEKAFLGLAVEFGDEFAPFATIASTSHLPWARHAVLMAARHMPKARVDLLQTMALTSNYPETRIEALLVMAELEPALALENALAIMKDSNPLIRGAAFRVIGQCRAPETEEPLMRGLDDPDEYVRTVAASAIFERNQKPAGKAAKVDGKKNSGGKKNSSGKKPGKK
ncbi:MAG TPA: HEAT repeat domain-containing protein [Myxococcota bacterium]|nr:HEAT repeat domain-containing protein [Myxococcota bacterium]HOD08240.1 HEAT repeat domain-containing protein [Myxococcota bacterium]HPB51107.1 HEAT repeat domain-containing protein [Myxococcota bacterium]HQP96060.1 HEAT repeat domain-containing protein [Myxococcota bacterium]